MINGIFMDEILTAILAFLNHEKNIIIRVYPDACNIVSLHLYSSKNNK